MTSRTGRGRWQRVLDVRQQARAALGHDPVGGDLYSAPPKRRTPLGPPIPAWNAERPAERPDQSEGVLSLGEAAARLEVGRATLEAMIAAGQVEVLPTGFTSMVPTREVQRLTSKENRR